MIPGTKNEFTAGSEIGSFTVVANAGRGAYGEVLIVRDVSGREYAMKIIQAMEDELSALRAIAEIKNADGLVPVHAAGKVPDGSGRLYYLMDAADNLAAAPNYLPDTLANRIARNGRFSAADVLAVAERLLTGLKKLHDNHLSHRDIKPENIIFRQGQPMLADFGLLARSDDGNTTPSGTEGFFPPEELSAPLNGASSPKNDLFALGKVIYCSWSGRSALDYPAFPENPDLRELKIIRKLYAKACSEKPAERFRSCDEFLTAVRCAQKDLSAGEKEQKKFFSVRTFVPAMIILLISGTLAVAAQQYFSGRKKQPESAVSPVLTAEPQPEKDGSHEEKTEVDPDVDLLKNLRVSDDLKKVLQKRLKYRAFYIAWYNEARALKYFCEKDSMADKDVSHWGERLWAITQASATQLCWRRCRSLEDHREKLEKLVLSGSYQPDDPSRKETPDIRRLRRAVFASLPEVTTLNEAREYEVLTPDLKQLVIYRTKRMLYYRAWLEEAKLLLEFCKKQYPDDPVRPKLEKTIPVLQHFLDADGFLRSKQPVREREQALMKFISKHGYPLEDPPAKEDDPDYIRFREKYISSIK